MTEENFCEIVIEIAHKDTKSLYKNLDMFQIIGQTYIPNKETLSQIYASLHSTPSKISRLIDANPTTPAEAEVVTHLKRLIKGLDEFSLKKFLRFCTASDVLLCNGIHVTFTSLVGMHRRPIFHMWLCVRTAFHMRTGRSKPSSPP